MGLAYLIPSLFHLFSFLITPETEKTKLQLLTKQPWRFNYTLETKQEDNDWILVNDGTDSCLKDDYIHFFEDGSYDINSGLIICKNQDQKQKHGTWQFSVYKTMLKMDNYSLTISILTEHKLQLIRKSNTSQDRMTFIH